MIDREPSAHSMTVEPAETVDEHLAKLYAENRRLSEELREQRRLADEVEADRDELAERVKALKRQLQLPAAGQSDTIAKLQAERDTCRENLRDTVVGFAAASGAVVFEAEALDTIRVRAIGCAASTRLERDALVKALDAEREQRSEDAVKSSSALFKLEAKLEALRSVDRDRLASQDALKQRIQTLERELGEARRHLSPPVADEAEPGTREVTRVSKAARTNTEGYHPDGRPLTLKDPIRPFQGIRDALEDLRREVAAAPPRRVPLVSGADVTIRTSALSDVKPRPDLLPAEALLEAGACLADRTDRDVAELPWFDRAPLSETLPKYRASLFRHVLAYFADELVDPKSTRPTLAHVITNAAILYRLENRAVLAARANAATISKES